MPADMVLIISHNRICEPMRRFEKIVNKKYESESEYEYKDISTINDRLTEVAAALEANKEYTELTAQELGFVLLIFKEGTQRIPTAIESFGQLFGIFQHYKTLLEQAVAQDEESKKDVPRIEELA